MRLKGRFGQGRSSDYLTHVEVRRESVYPTVGEIREDLRRYIFDSFSVIGCSEDGGVMVQGADYECSHGRCAGDKNLSLPTPTDPSCECRCYGQDGLLDERGNRQVPDLMGALAKAQKAAEALNAGRPPRG